jgi:hypothetical protein
MSTIANTIEPLAAHRRKHPVFWRFIWKEFRMVRGLWLAVAIMGFLVQCAAKLLLPPTTEIPPTLLSIALASAVLYAVGAAATAFSVEHEEETYDFLSRLPMTWLPLFAGKLLVTTVTAVLLACALAVTGWLVRGSNYKLTGDDFPNALGMLGFAIFEAIAWGTLFSLLIKRPLLAAIVTLVVGTISVNFVVETASNYSAASSNPSAYRDVLPYRLAIVALVFAASALIARRWLVGTPRSTTDVQPPQPRPWKRILTRTFGRVSSADDRTSRRHMFTRLLWQTWRENWRILPLPLLVSALLYSGFGAVIGISNMRGDVGGFVFASTLLFLPALYGSMAFYADQRRRNYQFLAEHAAQPRYVWLARHTVWLGSLVILSFGLALICLLTVGSRFTSMAAGALSEYIWGEQRYPPPAQIIHEITDAAAVIMRVMTVGTFGSLLAYSVGQLCSMLLRSEILAAFVALLLSTVVTAWIMLVAAWQLPGWLFILPLFIGFMAATWLRSPDWLAGRNSWRAWLKPAIAVALPIVFVAALLPEARDVPKFLNRLDASNHIIHIDAELNKALEAFEREDTPEARRTATLYIEAADRLYAGPKENLLAPWSKWQYEGPPSEDADQFGFIEKDIPTDQLEAFRAAREKQIQLDIAHRKAVVDSVIEISKRPSCRFSFDNDVIGYDFRRWPASYVHNNLSNFPQYQQLEILLNNVIFDSFQPTVKFETPASFDRLLAGVRMTGHIRSGQPSAIFVGQLFKEQEVLRTVHNWAEQKERTKQELLEAIEKLTVQFAASPKLTDPLLADYQLVRDVLTGKDDTPLVFTTLQQPRDYGNPKRNFFIPLHVHLAYLANQLPWERARALRALGQITVRNLLEVQDFTQKVADSRPREIRQVTLRRWLRPPFVALPELWETAEPAAMTSHFMVLEYRARLSLSALCAAYCDNETYRRGTLLCLALAAYRLDHKQYPPRLGDLVPAYIKELPLDPYSAQPFQYEPAGLSLPLKFQSRSWEQIRIEPHTPLLWSVGPGDVRLKQRENTEYEADEEANANAIKQTTEFIYHFPSSDPNWSPESTIVLPLPQQASPKKAKEPVGGVSDAD